MRHHDNLIVSHERNCQVEFVMFRSIVFALILLVAIPACGEERTVTIRGVMGWGSTDSAIDGLEPSCIFLSDSEIARKVISTCKHFDECKVIGTIDKNDVLLSINSIRKIDTNTEPSVDTIKDAASWALSVRQQVKDNLLYINSLHISNFRSTSTNGETLWSYEFELYGIYKNTFTNKLIGSGSVQVFKRGDTWHYNRQ